MDSVTVWTDNELDASTTRADEFKGCDSHSQTAETHVSGMDSDTGWVDKNSMPASAAWGCEGIGEEVKSKSRSPIMESGSLFNYPQAHPPCGQFLG
jgi:hypothetical protein